MQNEKLQAPYDVDGSVYNVSKKELATWIIESRKFIDKYPNFSRNSDIEEGIASYVSELIFDFYNFDIDTHIITPESKLGYEYFLDNADKNTYEYKMVKKCYDELKKHNFRETLKLHEYLYIWDKKYNCFSEKTDLYRRYKKAGKIDY